MRAADSQSPVATKESLQDVWSQVLQSREQMAQLIASKKLEDVEGPAFKIRDLLKKLPELSSKLPPDRLAKLKAAVDQMGKLAADLDATGDGNNLPGTQANAARLDALLRQIAAVYPTGSAADSFCVWRPLSRS